jgi:hypothetical protein
MSAFQEQDLPNKNISIKKTPLKERGLINLLVNVYYQRYPASTPYSNGAPYKVKFHNPATLLDPTL